MSTESIKKKIQSIYRQLIESLSLVPRYGQRQMIAEITNTLSRVADSQSDTPICVVEAGTGTGKTLAYLLSAVPVAQEYGYKVVISTATIALQEQVAFKDIPEVLEGSEMSFSYTIAKGRRRYLCLSKLHMLLSGQDSLMAMADLYDENIKDLISSETEVYESMLSAIESGKWKGDRDNWSGLIKDATWAPLTADHFQCTGQKCSYFGDCCFYKARDSLDSADCIVSNHDLVLTDLSMGGGVILPEPGKCIYVFDEAHHLPVKANNHFSETSSIRRTQNWIEGLRKELSQLRSSELVAEEESVTIIKILDSLGKHFEQTLPALQQVLGSEESNDSYENRVQHIFQGGSVPDDIKNLAVVFGTYFSRLISHLEEVNKNLRSLLDEQPLSERKHLIEQWYSILGTTIQQAESNWSLWTSYAKTDPMDKPPIARWFISSDHEGDSDISLYSSPVLAAENLKECLWETCAGAVLTSATLSALGNFEMLEQKAGLPPHASYLRIASPFNFAESAVFSVPRMNCDPTEAESHSELLAKAIPRLLTFTSGALMLFSSRRQMRDVMQRLPPSWLDLVLCQDDYAKSELLKYHRQRIDKDKGSIIFGLASFAEGVDLPGRYCDHVLIAKIPFSMPNDPVEMTLGNWVESQGKNSFMTLSVPDAAFRLVQASGRLLRNESDKGKITLFDERIVNRRYGKTILDSLPPYRREIFIEKLCE